MYERCRSYRNLESVTQPYVDLISPATTSDPRTSLFVFLQEKLSAKPNNVEDVKNCSVFFFLPRSELEIRVLLRQDAYVIGSEIGPFFQTKHRGGVRYGGGGLRYKGKLFELDAGVPSVRKNSKCP